MLAESAIVVLVVGGLLWAIHVIAVAAVQVLTYGDQIELAKLPISSRRRRRVDALIRNPQEVMLIADLFKALAFLVMALVVFWYMHRWSEYFGWMWIPVVGVLLVSLWVLRVLFGDVMPKAVHAEDPARTAPRGITRLTLLWELFRPVLFLARRIVGRHGNVHRSAEEREEILERTLETLAQSAGINEPVIEEDEREMIQGVMGLESTEVREVMVPRIRIIALEAGASMEDVRRLTAEHGHSRLPIFEGDLDSIIGILYIKDLFTASEATGPIDLASLARDPFVVPETKRVDALLEEFKRRQTHIAIVADEFGGTAGLVALEDILEEIVGEIQDEHDPPDSAIEAVADGTIMTEGVVPLDEIADALDVDLPDEKFETVGGLIYDRVGGIPEVGRTIEEYGLRFCIEAMDGQRISRVQVTRIASPPRSGD